MMNFDSWEAAARPPEDYLMHFRTRGSKNGVRRYQNPDGSWTELGLRERREREGWGDSKAERRSNKAVAKAERRLARSERRAERKQKREQRKFERAEKKRKSKLSGLTDEEMKAKLAERLTEFRTALLSGDYPCAESEDSCRYCTLRSICGRNRKADEEGEEGDE